MKAWNIHKSRTVISSYSIYEVGWLLWFPSNLKLCHTLFKWKFREPFSDPPRSYWLVVGLLTISRCKSLAILFELLNLNADQHIPPPKKKIFFFKQSQKICFLKRIFLSVLWKDVLEIPFIDPTFVSRILSLSIGSSVELSLSTVRAGSCLWLWHNGGMEKDLFHGGGQERTCSKVFYVGWWRRTCSRWGDA